MTQRSTRPMEFVDLFEPFELAGVVVLTKLSVDGQYVWGEITVNRSIMSAEATAQLIDRWILLPQTVKHTSDGNMATFEGVMDVSRKIISGLIEQEKRTFMEKYGKGRVSE